MRVSTTIFLIPLSLVWPFIGDVSFLLRGRKILFHKHASRTPARFSPLCVCTGCGCTSVVQRKRCARYSTRARAFYLKASDFYFHEENWWRQIAKTFSRDSCFPHLITKKVENKLRIILTWCTRNTNSMVEINH